MFEVPLDTPIECVHASDVGLALANGITSQDIWGRVLLIGGGPSCRIRQRDLIEAHLDGYGIGMLPDEAFTTVPYYCSWMGSDTSDQLLRYQRTSFSAYVSEMQSASRTGRRLIRPMRPLLRRLIVSQSSRQRSLV